MTSKWPLFSYVSDTASLANLKEKKHTYENDSGCEIESAPKEEGGEVKKKIFQKNKISKQKSKKTDIYNKTVWHCPSQSEKLKYIIPNFLIKNKYNNNIFKTNIT